MEKYFVEKIEMNSWIMLGNNIKRQADLSVLALNFLKLFE